MTTYLILVLQNNHDVKDAIDELSCLQSEGLLDLYSCSIIDRSRPEAPTIQKIATQGTQRSNSLALTRCVAKLVERLPAQPLGANNVENYLDVCLDLTRVGTTLYLADRLADIVTIEHHLVVTEVEIHQRAAVERRIAARDWRVIREAVLNRPKHTPTSVMRAA